MVKELKGNKAGAFSVLLMALLSAVILPWLKCRPFISGRIEGGFWCR